MPDPSELKRQAKDHAADIAAEAKDAMHHKTAEQAEHVQHAAADKVQNVADAASAAASRFDPDTMQAEAARQIADRVEGVARQIRTTDLDTLIKSASDYARRNPLLFIGAAATVGFAASRFLKAQSSSQTASRYQSDDPWSTGAESSTPANDDTFTAMPDADGGQHG